MSRQISLGLTWALFLGACFFAGSISVGAEPDVRPIPPPGIEVPQEARDRLQGKLDELRGQISLLQRRRDLLTPKYLPDVQIFEIAVSRALEENTFYAEQDIAHASELLETGLTRAGELLQGKHPWTGQSGLVARGYRSRIDGSVQPYGVVIGKGVPTGNKDPVRCDIWFRGRSEKGLELQFLYDRMHSAGEYQLEQGIVLHPFGRYCNANRFAGEVDVFEALEHAGGDYVIDPDRISVRGFSMGGAACWGFTVHYPCRWFASNPGAGFSETLQFRGLDKNPDQLPPWYEQRMWTLYDADVLADNLYDVPVIAYSGELDKQKLAADIMVEAAGKRGIQFPYVIGPETAHKLHPESKQEIAAQMDDWARTGRNHKRASVRFCTYSLKYNQCDWITLNGLEEHWKEAYVDGDVIGDSASEQSLKLKTLNCDDFTIDFRETQWRFPGGHPVPVSIDGQNLAPLKVSGDGRLAARFLKSSDGWKEADLHLPADAQPRKRHNLQGPVDDAFMDSFLFVEPTADFENPAVKEWVLSEQRRAASEWKRQMRGEVRVKKDTEITPEDLHHNHLILWGTPESNQLMGQIAGKLPVHWTATGITAGNASFEAPHHALILISPNPLNPEKYVVLNSGLTYREVDYLNNSWQTPKLPDWAIVDVRQAPSARSPGKIVEADFFDEHWQLKPQR